jgi:hypothetical protein
LCVEVLEIVNKCGCTNKFTCRLVMGLFFCFAAFYGSCIGVRLVSPIGGAILLAVAFICFVSFIISCCIRYCACCQYRKRGDE